MLSKVKLKHFALAFLIINVLILLYFPLYFLLTSSWTSQAYIGQILTNADYAIHTGYVPRGPSVYEGILQEFPVELNIIHPDFLYQLERNGHHTLLIVGGTAFLLGLLCVANLIVSALLYRLAAQTDVSHVDNVLQSRLLKLSAVLVVMTWIATAAFLSLGWNAGVIGNEQYLQPALHFIFLAQPTIILITAALSMVIASNLIMSNAELKQDIELTV